MIFAWWHRIAINFLDNTQCGHFHVKIRYCFHSPVNVSFVVIIYAELNCGESAANEERSGTPILLFGKSIKYYCMQSKLLVYLQHFFHVQFKLRHRWVYCCEFFIIFGVFDEYQNYLAK